MLLELDVGCGWHFKGTVNVDLFLGPKEISGREFEQEIYRSYRLGQKRIPNLVCALSACLPFKNGCFTTVWCRHLLEHKGVDVAETVKELVRVSSSEIIISVPSPFSRSRKARLHNKIFTRDTFVRMFKNFRCSVKYTRFKWMQLFVPLPIVDKIVHFLARYVDVLCPFPSEIVCTVTMEVKK